MDVSTLLLRGVVVLDGCKSCQAFFVYVNSKWIDGGDCDIDSQVEFIVIDEHGVSQVLTGDHGLFLRNLYLH